jgi:hypothetical protein
MPAFFPSAADHPASAQGLHFDAKAMCGLSASVVRLKSPFSRHIKLIIIYFCSACQPAIHPSAKITGCALLRGRINDIINSLKSSAAGVGHLSNSYDRNRR